MSSSGEVKQSRKNTDSIYHAGYDEDLKPIPMEKYFHPKRENKYKENPLKDDNNEYVPHKTGPRSRISINNTPPFNVRKLYPGSWTDEGHKVYDSKYPNGIDEKRKQKWIKKQEQTKTKKKFDTFINGIKNYWGWNDPFIIEFNIENKDGSIETFDSYIKQKISSGIDIECINDINKLYELGRKSVYEHMDDCIHAAITGENDRYGDELYNEPYGSYGDDDNDDSISGKKVVWDCINSNATFTIKLEKMEFKEVGIWHAKIKVQDCFGRNMIYENEACKNNKFEGGEWRKTML